ncbi:hypothetical protein FA95DRAFT_1555659 [Auriscalpium vulgare]|uniref:Uncharacterized protein n=1 Tax=Auriscalpium vulgare TaxID=40419 RepID=A0ACB8S360_9AGAM|nr:hypothetical protein FA95DRAFT_1555659 [Auriscalpium vulgare]
MAEDDATARAMPNISYLVKHFPDHVADTRAHLAGTIGEPPLNTSFFPPASYWLASEKALFFHGLSVYSRSRPDLIAAHIGTKSATDVAIYLALLRAGASALPPAEHIARDQIALAYEVSAELVAFEEGQSERFSAAEPVFDAETAALARQEAERDFRRALRAKRGEGKGKERDVDGQRMRREKFEGWRAEQWAQWGREDALAKLSADQLTALDRILREAEAEEELNVPLVAAGEPTDDAGQDVSSGPTPESAVQTEGPPTALNPADSSQSSPPFRDASPIVPTVPEDALARRRLQKRLSMRKKRAEAAGTVASLEPQRLKPGRKAQCAGKPQDASCDDDLLQTPGAGPSTLPDVEDGEVKAGRPKRKKKSGLSRVAKARRDLDTAGITATYLRDNQLGLFNMSALGRLMRTHADAGHRKDVGTHISGETISLLHDLVVNFVGEVMNRTITVRELDFTLKSHTKVWKLGGRKVLPASVHRALELMSFVFSDVPEEAEEVDPAGADSTRNNVDAGEVPDDDDDGEYQHEEEMNADADIEEEPDLSPGPRTMYAPFIYAPDIVRASHPSGVASRHEPNSPGHDRRSGAEDDELVYEMSSDSDEDMLDEELAAEERLDNEDMRLAAAYELGVWRELGELNGDREVSRSRKREKTVDSAESGEEFGQWARKRKQRRLEKRQNSLGIGLNEAPDGLRVKSAMIIEDSDE